MPLARCLYAFDSACIALVMKYTQQAQGTRLASSWEFSPGLPPPPPAAAGVVQLPPCVPPTRAWSWSPRRVLMPAGNSHFFIYRDRRGASALAYCK